MVVRLVVVLMAVTAANQPPSLQFQQAVDLVIAKGDCSSARPILDELARGQDRRIAGGALLYSAWCREKTGDDGAREAYQRVVAEFSDQPAAVAEARRRLGALQRPQTLADRFRHNVPKITARIDVGASPEVVVLSRTAGNSM